MPKRFFTLVFVIAIIIITLTACDSLPGMPPDAGDIDSAAQSKTDAGKIIEFGSREESEPSTKPTEPTEPMIQETTPSPAEEPAIPTEPAVSASTAAATEASAATAATAAPTTTMPTTERVTAAPATQRPTAAPATEPPVDRTPPVVTVSVNNTVLLPGSVSDIQEEQGIFISASHSSGISEIQYAADDGAIDIVRGSALDLRFSGSGRVDIKISAKATNGTVSAASTYTFNIMPKPTQAQNQPSTQPQTQTQTQPAPDASDFEREVLELTNIERAKYGLEPLLWDDPLGAVSRAYSRDMSERDFMSHVCPDGLSPFDRMDNAGIKYWAAAENLAGGQRTPAEVVEGWMNSPGHRANILTAGYTHLGVGFHSGGGLYRYYWTQKFATLRIGPAAADISDFERTVFDLVNTERENHGVQALIWDEALADVARGHSRDMAERGYFGSTCPDGLTPADRMRGAGIAFRAAVESLSAGQRTPEAVVEDWMNSPGHRANILNASYTHFGVGLYYGGEFGFYWTQKFRG
jgi:uncharacterized protein YkwD